MKGIPELWQELVGLALYVFDCLQGPISRYACGPVWTWVVVFSVMLAGVIFIAVLWSVWRYYADWHDAMEAQKAREAVAPPEVMEQHTWIGDQADPSNN